MKTLLLILCAVVALVAQDASGQAARNDAPTPAAQPTVAELRAKIADQDKQIAWLQAAMVAAEEKIAGLVKFYTAELKLQGLGPMPRATPPPAQEKK